MSAARKSPQGLTGHARHSLELRDERLRLVVVADTHGRPHEQSAARIAAARPDAILHAGDIGDLRVLDDLAKLAPLLAIRGNIDAHARDLPDTMTLSVLDQAGKLRLKTLLLHIGVYGPKLRTDAARLARAEGVSLVICGHSHVPFIGIDRGLGIFNPGSLGPRRFRLPIVFGVLHIDREGIRMHHVDCETGLVWRP